MMGLPLRIFGSTVIRFNRAASPMAFIFSWWGDGFISGILDPDYQ
jgi:hypothetical protein